MYNELKKPAFYFDLNRCTGCQACAIACTLENELDLLQSWRTVYTFNETHEPNLPQFHLSLACNHCFDAPCLKYCPALAIVRDVVTGAVLIDGGKCIGCKYCSWVCPYDAPKFNQAAGTMEKCTFCQSRLAEDLKPACVGICPTDALQFGAYTEKRNPEIPGFPDQPIRPAIHLTALRENNRLPAMDTVSVDPQLVQLLTDHSQKNEPKISLASEWTLLLFSLIAAFSVGWFAASVVFSSTFDAGIFAIICFTGIGVSTLHLGKKLRAWRALLNWKRSWLSREVLFFSLFTILAVSYGFGFLQNTAGGWLAVVFGFAALFAMDRVYDVLPQPATVRRHSARVLFTGLLVLALSGAFKELAVVLLLAKGAVYLRQKYMGSKTGRPLRPAMTVPRILIGIFLPVTLFCINGNNFEIFILYGIVIGEVTDRIEFYLQLDLSPNERDLVDRGT